MSASSRLPHDHPQPPEPPEKLNTEDEMKSTSDEEAEKGSGECKMTREAFDMLIKERKEEVKLHAIENRLEGLRRIRAMKSTSGINPLELFPKEIWIMIMGKLKSPQDRANICKTHNVFLKLMEDKMIRDVLLPLVIEHKIPFAGRHLLPWHFLPNSNPELAELVNLRLVSKELRDRVDKWIELHILGLMQDDRLVLDHRIVNTVNLRMDEGNSLNKLRRMLEMSNGSLETRPKRFFLRSLHVWILPNVNVDQREQLPLRFAHFKDNITKLLQTVGNQILHFRLTLAGIGLLGLEQTVTLTEIYNLLRNWLPSMPNLKWLGLKSMYMDIYENRARWIGNAFSDIENAPIPTVGELERLDLGEWSEFEFSMWDCVLRSNPHVKCFNKIENRYNVDPCTSPLVLSLPLEKANFNFRFGNRRWDFPLFLEQISNNNWNLKQITFWMDFKDAPTNSIASVFEFFEKFPAIEDLKLGFNHVKIGDEIKFVRLPNLKNLNMEIGPTVECGKECQYFFSLQFLLLCKNLELITWNNRIYDSQYIQRLMDRLHDEEEGITDFNGGVVKLSKSNIWNVFRKLKSVTIKETDGKWKTIVRP